MSSFWLGLLATAMRGLLGVIVWKEVNNLVADLAMTRLSGAEKRARVLEDLKRMFADVKPYLFNLAIEVAVTKLKERT